MHSNFISKLKSSDYRFKKIGVYCLNNNSIRKSKVHFVYSENISQITCIYVILVNKTVIKIGETEDLLRRLDKQYTIPFNENKNSITNIRISKYIQDNLKSNPENEISVYIHKIVQKKIKLFETNIIMSYHKNGEKVLINIFNNLYPKRPLLFNKTKH